MIGVAAFLQAIRSNRQHLFLSELICDLRRTASFHAKIKNVLDHFRCFFIHKPFLRIVWILDIAVWKKSGQRLAAFSLRLDNGADLPAGITGIELVEPHAYSGKIVVHAVLILRVEVVVDGNVADIVLGESDIDKHTCHGGVASEARKVFCQHDSHMIRFDFVQHLLKAGSIKIRSAVSVVNEENGIWKFSVSREVTENAALILYAITLPIQGILI